jgi:hypothetical protein
MPPHISGQLVAKKRPFAFMIPLPVGISELAETGASATRLTTDKIAILTTTSPAIFLARDLLERTSSSNSVEIWFAAMSVVTSSSI